MLFFASIWSAILGFIAWWVILFTGRYPQSWFEYQAGLMSWQVRLNARMLNLSDGYPAFGTKGSDDNTKLEIPYPESLSRGLLLLRTFLGIFYIIIPHMFILYFRLIGTMFMVFLAWWVVLFTGKYPANWHAFNVGYIRWTQRLSLYLLNMTDTYPPFSGKE